MNWQDTGKKFGMFVAAALPLIVPAYMDIRSRIDAGKDEQRAHWISERRHKDSMDKMFQDSVMFYLRKENGE